MDISGFERLAAAFLRLGGRFTLLDPMPATLSRIEDPYFGWHQARVRTTNDRYEMWELLQARRQELGLPEMDVTWE